MDIKRYFLKDGALRHYTQHLVIALVVFLIFRLYIFEEASFIQISLFILFSFLIDLDSVVTIFVSKRNRKFKEEILELLKEKRFEEVMIYATKNHKKINNLKLHNLLFYAIFSSVLILCIFLNRITLAYIFLAIVAHMTFDIFDDLRNLGHLKHWERIK